MRFPHALPPSLKLWRAGPPVERRCGMIGEVRLRRTYAGLGTYATGMGRTSLAWGDPTSLTERAM